MQRWSAALSVLGLARGERRGLGEDKSYSRPERRDFVGYSAGGSPWGRRGVVGRSRWVSGEGRGGGEVGIAGIACEVSEYAGLSRRFPFLDVAG